MLTHHSFIEMCLRMLWGSREQDVLSAYKMLGGLGFASKHKARRIRLLRIAEEIAARVGHGEKPEPLTIHPDTLFVPITLSSQATEIFMGSSK